jgi:hypothetical protein
MFYSKKKLLLNETSVAPKSSHQVDSPKKREKKESRVVVEGGEISKWEKVLIKKNTPCN